MENVNPQTLLAGWTRLACAVGFLVAASLLLPCAALAVTFTVNSTDDGADVNPGDGKCSAVAAPAPPVCTLRAAIMEANRAPNLGALIKLPASAVPYTLQIFPHDSDGEYNGDLNLFTPAGYTPGPVQIIGDGAAVTIIDANGIDRILSIEGGRTVSISGVTLRNGFTSSSGGAIYCDGHLTLTDVEVTDNTSTSSSGGGIYGEISSVLFVNHSVLSGNKASSGGGIAAEHNSATVTESILTDNHANAFGGGIYTSGELTLDRSTLSGNTAAFGGGLGLPQAIDQIDANVSGSTISGNWASQSGGGISNDGTSLNVINSTIAGNSAQIDGGGIYNLSTINVYNSTIAYNQSDSNGDGIGAGPGVFNTAGAVFNLRNSVVAGNHYPGPYGLTLYNDCHGALTSYGANRFYSFTDCSVTQSGAGSATQLVPSASMGALQDNGGTTLTIALKPAPNANLIDFALTCSDQNNATLTTDQRGRKRIVGASCDVGAFEYDAGDIFINGFQ